VGVDKTLLLDISMYEVMGLQHVTMVLVVRKIY